MVFLDEDWELLTHVATHILEDFNQNAHYKDWPVKIGIFFKGSFYLFIETGSPENLNIDDYQLHQFFGWKLGRGLRALTTVHSWL